MTVRKAVASRSLQSSPNPPVLHVSANEALKGKSGWLALSQFSVESLDHSEDHLIFSAVTDEGEELEEEAVEFLKGKGFTNIEEIEVMPENVRFGLPPEIVEAIEAAPAAVAE